MVARRLLPILPPLWAQEVLEVIRFYSVAGLLPPGGLVRRRPFRSPHHTTSAAAVTGGGPVPRPGEVTLAHRGVLFLDELPEFHREALEALRQPLEDGLVTVARVQSTVTFPARLTLVGAMNRCPCGHRGDALRECLSSPAQVARYLARVSGPLLNRIDLHVEVPRVSAAELLAAAAGESSAQMRARVLAVREVQARRYGGARTNGALGARQARRYCRVDEEGTRFLQRALERLGLSARAHDCILKVARTIADLEGADAITTAHLAEAVQYRTLDRSLRLGGWGSGMRRLPGPADAVGPQDPDSSPALRATPDPPGRLYLSGLLTGDDAVAVAVVGARRATLYGVAVARRLAAELACCGVAVVSGLARGIDAAAHDGALDAGGRTVAVLGCGPDVVYPPEHAGLMARVVASGAVLSEYPPGTPPLRHHFPRRNRLISGLSLGVVVVEGREDSGALVTADCALEQGWEVFAVPGPVMSATSALLHRVVQ